MNDTCGSVFVCVQIGTSVSGGWSLKTDTFLESERGRGLSCLELG